MTGGSSGYSGINVFGTNDHVFIVLMYLRFCRYDKMCSHLHTSGAQHKGRCNASAITDSSGCNHRDLHGIHHLWYQRHGSAFAHMAAGFTAFCNHRIGTCPLHSLCHGHRSHNRNHFYSGFFPHLHIFFRTSGTGGHHLHAFFHNDFCHIICIRTHEHNVHTKWFVCQFLRLLNLFSDPVRRCTGCTDQPKPACF